MDYYRFALGMWGRSLKMTSAPGYWKKIGPRTVSWEKDMPYPLTHLQTRLRRPIKPAAAPQVDLTPRMVVRLVDGSEHLVPNPWCNSTARVTALKDASPFLSFFWDLQWTEIKNISNYLWVETDQGDLTVHFPYTLTSAL